MKRTPVFCPKSGSGCRTSSITALWIFTARLYPERVQYTWWTYISNARQRGVGWRIDYFLVSEALASRVKDVIIHEEVLGSDHCPVELLIE